MRWEWNRTILLRLLVSLVLISLLAIAPRPHPITRLYWRARQAIDSGDPLVAAARLAELAESMPEGQAYWEQAGLLALEGGDPQKAVRYLEQARSLRALSTEGELALGDAHQQQGDWEAAAEIWETIVRSSDPPVEVYQRLYTLHMDRGDFPAAIADLQALTTRQPAEADLRYQLGLLLAAYRPETALPYLDQAAELDPKLQKSVQKLTGSIQRARREEDQAYTLVETGRALASLGEWELASEAFQQAIQIRADYADAWAYLGEARQHVEAEEQPDALQALQEALELDPDSFSANTFLALYWHRQGRYEQALTHLQTASKKFPDNPAIQVELGSTLAMLGKLEQALEAYQRAVALAPEDPVHLIQLASFSVQYEYLVREVGLPAARQAVILAAEDPAALDTMGQVLVMLEDADNAERFFNLALEADPQYAPAHLHLGLIYILRGESTSAYRKWKLVLSLAPGSPFAEQAQRLLDNNFP